MRNLEGAPPRRGREDAAFLNIALTHAHTHTCISTHRRESHAARRRNITDGEEKKNMNVKYRVYLRLSAIFGHGSFKYTLSFFFVEKLCSSYFPLGVWGENFFKYSYYGGCY